MHAMCELSEWAMKGFWMQMVFELLQITVISQFRRAVFIDIGIFYFSEKTHSINEFLIRLFKLGWR